MAPDIVPRWEWRTFGERIGRADDILGATTPESVSDSDELYFLSVRNNASVKVRDELMDVKQLLRVNDDGLELWKPEMKSAFPLSRDDTSTVLATLNVER